MLSVKLAELPPSLDYLYHKRLSFKSCFTKASIGGENEVYFRDTVRPPIFHKCSAEEGHVLIFVKLHTMGANHDYVV